MFRSASGKDVFAALRRIAFAAVFGGAVLAASNVQAQVLFTTLPAVQGVEADRAGNVYFYSQGVNGFLPTTVLSRWLPNGIVAASLPELPGASIATIARIPNSDVMLLLTRSGGIYSFGTNLKLSLFADLTSLNSRTALNVFDVSTGSAHNVLLGVPVWGDIAVAATGPNTIGIYISATTGSSVGAFPFVLRISANLATIASTTFQFIVTSAGTLAGTVPSPPGIAVNSAGIVVTTMPYPIPGGGFGSTLVAFRTSFPQTLANATVPRYVLRNSRTVTGLSDMSSNGMTADAAGNFYIASGVVGSSLCGFSGSGALILVGPDPITTVPAPRCFSINATLGRSLDVAVNPVTGVSYMTVQTGQILQFPRLVP